MATSLSRQLTNLRSKAPDNTSYLGPKGRRSLLFGENDAAVVSIDTIFSIGVAGFRELVSIDERFSKFENGLFSETAKNIVRSIETATFNKQLDDQIEELLYTISPYFLLKPTAKVLEWLFRRFMIQTYNCDAIFGCILPYHETKLFARVLQMIPLSSSSHQWNWLHQSQRKGVAIAKQTLLTHCTSDLSFLSFICSMVDKSIAANAIGAQSNLKVVLSFYATTILGVLNRTSKIDENLISKIMPTVNGGLSSDVVDYKCTSYMILAQLCTQSQLKTKFVTTTLFYVCKSICKEVIMSAILCLNQILVVGNVEQIQKSAHQSLAATTLFQEELASLSKDHCLDKTIYVFFRAFVSKMVDSSKDETQQMILDDDVKRMKEFLSEVSVRDENQRKAIVGTLLNQYMSARNNNTLGKSMAERFCSWVGCLLAVFDSRYSSIVDSTLSEALRKYENSSSSVACLTWIEEVTVHLGNTVKHQIVNESKLPLVTSLLHHQSVVRLQAITKLMEVASSLNDSKESEADFLESSICLRLDDDSIDVVQAVLSKPSVLIKCVGQSALLEHLAKIMKKGTFETKLLCCGVLCEFPSETVDNKLINSMLLSVLPELFLSFDHLQDAQRLAELLSKGTLHKWHSVIRGVKEAVQKIDWPTLQNNGSHNELICKANFVMLESIAISLAKSDYTTIKTQFVTPWNDLRHMVKSNQPLLCAIAVLLSNNLDKNVQGLLCVDLIALLLDKQPQNIKKAGKLTMEWFNGDQLRCLKECLQEISSKASDGEPTVSLPKERLYFMTLKQIIDHGPRKGDAVVDNNAVEKLHVMIFELLAKNGGQHPSKKNFVSLYRSFLELFFEATYPDAGQMIEFLSSIFSSNEALDWQNMDSKLDAVSIQVCSLHVTSVGLKRVVNEAKGSESSIFVQVFPRLLSQLSHPLLAVRQIVLQCFQVMVTTTFNVKSFPLRYTIEGLLEHKNEIIMDSQRVPYICKQILSKPNASKKETKIELNAMVAFAKSVVKQNKSIMLKLLPYFKHVHNHAVMEQFWPVLTDIVKSSKTQELGYFDQSIIRIMFKFIDDKTANIFETSPIFLSTYINILNQTNMSKDALLLQHLALQQLDAKLFDAIADCKVKARMWQMLLTCLIESEDPAFASRIKITLQELELPTNEVVTLMNSLLNDINNVDEPRTKRNKRSTVNEKAGVRYYESNAWKTLVVVLEIICSWDDIRNGQLIVPLLFTFFAKCVPLTSENYSSADYMKQIIMASILSISTDIIRNQPHGTLKAETFNVELVVQCLRTSDDTQTHQKALMLLRMAADVFPDQVLHNVMTIFTFMGAKVLRQDDSYTFEVIDKTMETIIPVLLKTNNSAPSSAVEDLVKVIARVFVDAAPHIPEHRRLSLFKHFVAVLDPDRYLYLILLLLLEKFVSVHGLSNSNKKSGAFGIDFCCTLLTNYSSTVEASTLKKILTYLPELPDEKPEDSKVAATGRTPRRQKPTVKSSCPVFDVAQNTAKELRQFKYIVLDFVCSALSDAVLVKKFSEAKGPIRKQVDSTLLETLEVLFVFAKRLGLASDAHNNDATAKFWKAIHHKSCDVSEKIYSLLPFRSFVVVMEGLVKSDNVSVKKKGLEMLSAKLNLAKTITKPEESSLMSLTHTLIEIIKDGENLSSHTAIEQQTALYTLKILIRVLCKGERTSDFVLLVPIVTSVITDQQSKDVRVAASAVLCLSELCHALKAHVIPHLAAFIPPILALTVQDVDESSKALVTLSCLTSLEKIISSLASFLSPYVSQMLTVVCQVPIILADIESSTKESSTVVTQLSSKANSLCDSFAKHFKARILLPGISKCYEENVDSTSVCCTPLMRILEQTVVSMSRDNITDQNSKLITMFIKLLDARTEWSCASTETPRVVEDHVINAFCCYTIKLSEKVFRPVFLQIFDWATSETEKKDRLLTFYNLSAAVASKLKGIFLLFVGHILQQSCELLHSSHSKFKGESSIFLTNSQEKSSELSHHLLRCLHSCFMYDNQKFFNKERFDALLQPLVDQIDNSIGTDEEYLSRITETLVPCLGYFAVAVDDINLWKILNQQILKKTRHKHSQVRLSSLFVLEEVQKKIGESYAALLPETIPYLAEMMEDESPAVEKKCQDIISQLEEIVGESLQKYF